MTMISRLGFKPTKKHNIKSEFLVKTEDITIVIPVKDNQDGIDLFLTEFFKTHDIDTYPKEIIIVDNNSNPSIKIIKDFPVPV